jgi:hypothetical protein
LLTCVLAVSRPFEASKEENNSKCASLESLKSSDDIDRYLNCASELAESLLNDRES